MKKNILIFGANSFIGNIFIEKYKDAYTIYPVYKHDPQRQLNFDFVSNDDRSDFARRSIL